MQKIIGIRRENKNEWERRVPIIPSDISELYKSSGIKTILQPSKVRIFSDLEYLDVGAEINEELNAANIIFAIKEIPIDFYQKNKTYVFFSHTIKGQSYNMDKLRRMMELKCNLIDYEKIENDRNQRLIFFGHFAGLAGMIETLVVFGQKTDLKGYETPFEKLKQAYQYNSMDDAKIELEKIGQEIINYGFPLDISPVIIGFAGYGHVSRGAQEIFNLLPYQEISPNELLNSDIYKKLDAHHLYKVVFKEEDLVEPRNGNFDLQDYYDHPEKYLSKFERYLPYLNVLLNCIYWTEAYPRLVTKKYLARQIGYNVKLEVIGDISCDINGSIEITYQTTKPDKATYTYYPKGDYYKDGTQKAGLTIMAIDNLPCEFPLESSIEFSTVLKNFVVPITEADFNLDYEYLNLPDPVKRGLILHKGRLTPEYQYIERFI